MFPPNFWLSDPFDPFTKRHSDAHTPYAYEYYNASPPHNHRTPKKPHHHTTPAYTPSTSTTDLDTITDTDTIYSPYTKRRHHPPPPPSFEPFSPQTLRLPPQSSHALHPSEILILPTLTRLKISLEPAHTSIRAAVPPSMRLRDVVKQLIPAEHLPLARVYVKLRGEWVEAGAPLKVGEIGEMGRYVRGGGEDGSVRVRVVVETREREREVERRGFGWEMGGRVERMRVY